MEIYERLAKTNPDTYEIEFCRSIVLLGLLQKADFQTNGQSQIEGYLSKAKQILQKPKYQDVPLAKTLLGNVNDLEEYFNNLKIFSGIQTLQNQLQKEEKYAEKIKIQEKIIGEYRHLVANGYQKFANELGSSLSSLAWYQLFEKQFSNAEISAKEAINPTKYAKIDG